jgi:hypothetical protein
MPRWVHRASSSVGKLEAVVGAVTVGTVFEGAAAPSETELDEGKGVGRVNEPSVPAVSQPTRRTDASIHTGTADEQPLSRVIDPRLISIHIYTTEAR